MPPRAGDEGDTSGVVSDLLDEARHLLLDLLEPRLTVGKSGGVHLVDGHDKLLHTQGVGKEGELSGLAVLGDTIPKLSGTGSDIAEDTLLPVHLKIGVITLHFLKIILNNLHFEEVKYFHILSSSYLLPDGKRGLLTKGSVLIFLKN